MRKIVSEELKLRAEALYYVALSVAIIFGGGWTLLNFFPLKEYDRRLSEIESLNAQATKARTEIQNLNTDRLQVEKEIEKLQKSLEEKSYLHIDFKVENIAYSGNTYIEGKVELINRGEKDVFVKVEEDSLTIEKVEIDKHGIPDFSKHPLIEVPIQFSESKPVNYVLYSGQLESIPILIEVKEPGIYYLQLEFFLEKSDRKDYTDVSKTPGRKLTWRNGLYIFVEKTHNKQVNKDASR